MEKRQSNIELLRIISILAVVLHHYSIHTGWTEVTDYNRLILKITGMGGATAINIFVIITGYFSISSKSDTKKKVIKLWKQRLLYSVLISGIMLALGIFKFSKKYLAQAIFPVLTCRHNYITTFILLYLFIPFLNKGIHALNEQELKRLLIIFTLVISVIPTIMTLVPALYTNNVYSYLMWMFYLYYIGAYLRLNGGVKNIYHMDGFLWHVL